MALIGIDEVGRGPLAGPLVVGAVILPCGGSRPEWVGELRDSKKLSAKKREKYAEMICAGAAAWGLGWVSAGELDEVGMSKALQVAARRAMEAVREMARERGVKFSQIVIDGKVNFLAGTSLERYVSTAVKADDLVKEVSAASIVAKVARDAYMKRLGVEYPEYGFEKHAGYGTAKHLAAIREVGICPEHRRSFEPIRSMVGFEREGDVCKNTTAVGKRGEEAVCEYLVQAGHTVVMRNYKTKMCEIDIVSIEGDTVYFTEVKMRKNGNPLENIDRRKLDKMKLGVEVFMKMWPEFRMYNPLLAAASVDGEFEVEEWVIIR